MGILLWIPKYGHRGTSGCCSSYDESVEDISDEMEGSLREISESDSAQVSSQLCVLNSFLVCTHVQDSRVTLQSLL